MSVADCPSCSAPIPLDDINVSEGVALCRPCGKLFKLSQLAEDPELAQAKEDLRSGQVPPGCTVVDRGMGEIVVRASARSFVAAGGLMFFALFWNSIVSVFLVVALAGLYTSTIGPLPSWAPAPTSSSGSGPMGVGMSIFMLLFMVPFVLVGTVVLGAALVSLMGHVEARIGDERDADAGCVFIGVGKIGWRRRFKVSAVKNVKIGLTGSSTNDKPDRGVIIEADRTIKFGSMLPDERRRWMAATLKTLLMPERRALSRR